MNDHLKTRAELIKELESFRKCVAEDTPSERKQAKDALKQKWTKCEAFTT